MRAGSPRATPPARALAVLVGALAAALVVTGCSTTDELPTASSLGKPTATPTPPVLATGLAAGTKVTVTDSAAGASPGDHLSFASPVYTVAASGPLDRSARLELELDHALPRRTPVVVVTRRTDQARWSYLAGTLTSDQRHVQVATTRTGQVGVLAVDRGSVVEGFKGDFRAQPAVAEVDRTVKPPTCRREKAARKEGYQIDRPTGRSLVWCFGLDGDKRVLKIANRRALPVQLDLSGGPRPLAGPVRARWVAWLGALGAGGTTLTRARTATYSMELPAETERTVSVVTGRRAQALRLLMVSVQSVAETLTRFGTGPTDRVRVYDSLLARPLCARALNRDTRALLARCLSPVALRAVLGDRALLLDPLVTAPSLPRFLQRQAAARGRRIARNEAWQLVVRRKAPDFSRLVGTFTGTTRRLTISSTGLVVEKVSATVQPAAKAATPAGKNGGDGKGGTTGKNGKPVKVPAPEPVVKPVIELVYQLGYPSARAGVSRVEATVVRVAVRNPSLLGGRAPRVGATGTLSLAKGVLRPPFLQVSYCGRGAAKGACS